ncbi:MAG: hypothetical protein ACFCGT_12340 [Sandaracinaceae bacterium]
MRAVLTSLVLGMSVFSFGCLEVPTVDDVIGPGAPGATAPGFRVPDYTRDQLRVLHVDVSGDFATARDFVTERAGDNSALLGEGVFVLTAHVDNPSRRQYGMHRIEVTHFEDEDGTLEPLALEPGDTYVSDPASGTWVSLIGCSGRSVGTRYSNEDEGDEVVLDVLEGPSEDTVVLEWSSRFHRGREAYGVAVVERPGLVDL